jgi:hypothetical protein
MAGRNKRKTDAEQHNEDLMDLVPQKPLEIVGLTVDHKGNFFGLGNNGMLYKYHTDSREWVLL